MTRGLHRPALATTVNAALLLALLAGCSTGTGGPSYTEDLRSLTTGLGGAGGAPASPATGGYAMVGLPDVPPPVAMCPPDACPVTAGVPFNCLTRFVYGTNMAWDKFSLDFGGHAEWAVTSISQDPTRYSNLIADMKAHGINVIRWWMFPDFRGDGVTFDENGVPTGVTQTVLDDLTQVLELAQIHDVYLMLTLFSFDGFKPDDKQYMTPLVLDKTLRAALVEKVVRPIAAQAEASEYSLRVHSWDLINEPEWAMLGPSLYGDPAYLPNDQGTDTVTHGEMEQFLAEVNTVLRQESTALISVGASMKWPMAWTGLDTDFHQLHYYPWMEPDYPLDTTPAKLGLTDKPVVLGEFPGADKWMEESKYTYREMVDLALRNGWAGALGWDWNSSTAANKDAVQSFATDHACETAY